MKFFKRQHLNRQNRLSIFGFMQSQHRGFLYGALAAICYGTNPLGALYLYKAGFTPGSVLFYRFAGASILSALFILFLRKDFRVPKANIPYIGFLGFLFAASALCLYLSFLFMDAGVASTLLFSYPIMVAVFMVIFFKEKLQRKTVVSILLAISGVVLLMRTGDGSVLSPAGIALVFFSSLAYAIYIVIAARMPKPIGALKMNMYIFAVCALCLLVYSLCAPGHSIHPVKNLHEFAWLFQLAFMPSLLSLIFMQKALRTIGSTPTAILGALEPLTAVCIGVGVFHEALSARLVAGIIFILCSVTLLALKRNRI